MTQPVYNTGAVGYDEFFGQVTRLYIPARLEAGRLRQGRVDTRPSARSFFW